MPARLTNERFANLARWLFPGVSGSVHAPRLVEEALRVTVDSENWVPVNRYMVNVLVPSPGVAQFACMTLNMANNENNGVLPVQNPGKFWLSDLQVFIAAGTGAIVSARGPNDSNEAAGAHVSLGIGSQQPEQSGCNVSSSIRTLFPSSGGFRIEAGVWQQCGGLWSPGNTIQITNITSNTSMWASATWAERRPSEGLLGNVP